MKALALGLYETKPWSIHWRGVREGFTNLGYEFKGVESRNTTIDRIRQEVFEFSPDVIWLDCVFDPGHIDIHKMLELIKEFKTKLKVPIMYFDGDLRDNPPLDLKEVVDIIFLSHRGGLVRYTKNYNHNNVHYLPPGCLKRDKIADPDPRFAKDFLIFVGQINNPLYKSRNMFIQSVKDYQLPLKVYPEQYSESDVYGFLPQLYATAKVIIGVDMTDDVDLFTSNRVFITLGYGGFLAMNYFPGIDELFIDGKHLKVFHNYSVKELYNIFSYYLNHEEERNQIRYEGFKFVQENHTYTNRIKDALDLLNGKIKQSRAYLSSQ